jgi:D-3-phosphoglycerate dehydrogenase / 2-oxoglutarate reductase
MNGMWRILNAEPLNYTETARQILQSIGLLDEQALTRAELIDRLCAYQVLIVRLGFQIDREVIDAGSQLKVIVTATTGLDHIDVAYAAQRGIAVLSLQGEVDFLHSIPATAEHTWALLLALVRRVPWAFQSVLAGEWQRDEYKGHDLKGRRLGIIGLGRIGGQVARYGLAFGMTVLAYDPFCRTRPDEIIFCATLPELLAGSDIVTLHVPLNAATEKMMGEREFAMLPPGAVVINTSRGAVLDEAALLAALCAGQLTGAALDVVVDERASSGLTASQLWPYAREHQNLLITPHLGGATFESMAATEIFMAQRLQQYWASDGGRA